MLKPYRTAAPTLLDLRIGTILAAVDNTARAPAVLGGAAAMAAHFGATLYLYRAVVIPPDFAPAAHVEEVDHLPQFLERQALRELKDLMLAVPASKMAQPLVSFGDPWRAILETAARLAVDMIVMGSHGYHGVDWVIGTTTGKVSTRAGCHVFVVHDNREPKPAPAK